jgi:hypothetical protein
MSLSDLASLGSFVSGIAVLVSLIYLSLQVRQTEKNQKAIVQQGRIARSSDQLFRLADPLLTRVWLKGLQASDDMTEEESFQFVLVATAVLRSSEDVFFQHSLGLLDQASLNNQLAPLRGVLSTRSGAALWKVIRPTFDPEFALRVDPLVPAELGVGQYGIIAAWKAELAGMARS